MSDEPKRRAALPPPRLTQAEKQTLLAPWLERRRAEIAAYEAATDARAEKVRAERRAAALLAEPFFTIEDELDCTFSGCGAACDCCWYLRCECAFGRHIEWHGGRFMIIDHDGVVIGEADPGFSPLPKDVEWAARVEYAQHYGLPHPYRWTTKMRAEYDRLHPAAET